jgi:FkbM family methyltransferase
VTGPQSHLIEFRYRGRTCRFDGTPAHGLANPGVIYGTLLTGRFYEHAFLDYVRSLQVRGVYVDVGSCIGTHALFFALMCPSTRVYAFEPRDFLYERVLTNIALNEKGRKIKAYPLGLSDRTGRVTVNLDRRECVLACRRLDDVIRGRVDLIKIDVEGMEPRVLDGAARTLARWRPLVFAEAGKQHEYEALVACMARHRYRPSGRVFNATPTYEFVPEPLAVWERHLGRVRTELPWRVRQSVRRLARRYPVLKRRSNRGLRSEGQTRAQSTHELWNLLWELAPAVVSDFGTCVTPDRRLVSRDMRDTSPGRTQDHVRERIVALRTELTGRGLDAGPVTIAWHLGREGHAVPSTSTIRRILHAAGLVVPEARKRPRSSWIRFEASTPNELWQSDFTSTGSMTSTASMPSSRYRRRSRCKCPRLIPYSAAAAVTDDCVRRP